MKQNNFYDRLMRAPDGVNPAPAASDPSAVAAADPAAQTPPPVNAQPDLSFIPGDYVKDGAPDLDGFKAHYQDIVARDAQYAQRMADVPEDGAYDWKLPEGFKFEGMDLPEDFAIDLKPDDPALQPLYAELGATLKDYGIPKAEAGRVLGILAKYEATKVSQAYAAHKAEMGALGTPAQQTARIAAATRSLQTKLPAALAEGLMAAVSTAKGVQAIEALLTPAQMLSPGAQPRAADTEGLRGYELLKVANSRT